MKKRIIIIALLLLLPNLVFAKQNKCKVHGQKDFTISFNVLAMESGQSVILDEGNHGYVLWYTNDNQIPEGKKNKKNKEYEVVFYEDELLSGNIYNIIITHESDTKTLTYYRKLDSEPESSYDKIKIINDLKPGGYTVIESEGAVVKCSEKVEPPTVPPITEPDIGRACRYFPEPIQGWKGSISTLNIQNPAQISGWSSEYLNDDTNIYSYQQDWSGVSWENLRVGFDKGYNKWWLYEKPSATSCDGYGCFPGDGVSGDGVTVGDDGFVESRKAETPTNITPNFGSSSLYISPDKNDAGIVTEEFCNNNPSICSYGSSSSGLKEPQITVLSSLKNLTINNHNDTFDKLTVVIADGVQIESVNISRGDNVIFQTLDDSTVTFGNWKEDTGATVYSFGNNSRINIVNSFNMENKMKVANTNSVTLYAPEGDIDFSTANDEFYGFILGKTVSFSNPITVHGAVTSQNLTIHTTNVVIKRPTDACSTGGGNIEGMFVVEPRWQYGLTCEQIPVDFKLLNDRGELIDSNDSFVPIVSPDSNTTWCSSEQGSSCDLTSANLSNGEKTLYLSAENIGDLAVGAIYDSQNHSGGSVKFVPYKLHATPSVVEMIAGEDTSVSVQALSCYGDQAEVVKNYNSSLAMSLDNYELEKPNTGSLYDFNVSDLQFTNGSTDATVTWQDAGQTKVVFEDAKFDCSDYEQEGANLDCPIDGGVLKGEFTVKSRPWKIAICDVKSKEKVGDVSISNPGTQATGDGFIPAGESFNVTYKPIVHSDSRGDANNVCDYPLTQNYFSDSNTAAPLDAEFSVLYPSGGDIANLDSSNVSSLEFSPENAKTGKTVEYVWHEVGSLSLKTKATYLDEKLDGYEVTVGRFYPGQFSVYENREAGMSTLWAYPNEQSFTYMGQPFGLKQFYIEALSKVGGALRNYAYFGKSYQAKFNLYENNSDNVDRFIAQSDYSGSWLNDANDAHVSGQSVGKFSAGDLVWNKVVSKPDGPLNYLEKSSDTSISIAQSSSSVDKTGVTIGTKELNVQPDIRFGRVNLDDVGGRQGETLHVPLRVEYWNGSRFVVNSNDSQTDVSGIKWGQDHIWPTGEGAAPKDVNLGDGGEVSSGSSRSVTATQAESYRQQTRVWLDLEANDLPWLKYDWEKESAGKVPVEENPSSVVTFGIHRGNDRVIYRGEPGLTAQ
ncbi:DUF6701 domain-containing protein [uncultured Vibrio sp.]|uniref:DUF6701 domain-containing protein n=1 Tax=uncultured Vibrio sp. TaxID=114054 RepID=UPI002AA8B1ED|nr:DUF6701 domain-containing protein [uncultured Vibrio sp.]